MKIQEDSELLNRTVEQTEDQSSKCSFVPRNIWTVVKRSREEVVNMMLFQRFSFFYVLLPSISKVLTLEYTFNSYHCKFSVFKHMFYYGVM